MRIAAVSQVEMTVDPTQASARILWRTTRLQGYCMIAASVAGMLCLLYPVLLIGIDAATSPQVINTIADRLGSTLLLAVGVLIGLATLYFPLRSGLARLAGAGTVRLASGQVQVERRGLTGPERWSAPLSEFCGVTHHVRATLSGQRHEIILVHPDPAKDVLLSLTPRHPHEGSAYYADLLGLSELPPRELYQRRRSRPVPHTPAPTARAA